VKFAKDFKGRNAIGNSGVRSLPRQPPIRAFGQAPQETQEWAGNPGFSHIRLRLQAPGLPKLRVKSLKVSGRIRKYSRFAETIVGDGSITTAARPYQKFEVPLRSRFLFERGGIAKAPRIRSITREMPANSGLLRHHWHFRIFGPFLSMSVIDRLKGTCWDAGGIDANDRASQGRELPVREGLTRIIVDWSGSWQAARPGNWLGRSPATKAALGC
jgi:hypothetical protein